VLCSLDASKLLCKVAADALCSLGLTRRAVLARRQAVVPSCHRRAVLARRPFAVVFVAADAPCLLDGSELSCLVAADELCLLDGSKPFG